VKSQPAQNRQTGASNGPVTERMFQDAVKDFSNPHVEIVKVSNCPNKVEVSPDGQSVFVGGNGLGVLRYVNGWLCSEGVVFTNPNCTIKAVEDGQLLMNDLTTNDLTLLDQSFQEKGKIAGTASPHQLSDYRVKTRTGEDDNNMLWLSGAEHISIVKLHSMTSSEIRFFWTSDQKPVQPIAAAITPSGHKIVGIGLQDGKYTLHYYDGSDSVTTYTGTDVSDKLSTWECLEIDFDEDVCFLGGGDTNRNGRILILALEESVDQIGEGIYNGMGSVTAMKRHPGGDILFAGGYKLIQVLLYQAGKLLQVSQISIDIESPTRDLVFSPTRLELFAVFELDRIATIMFDEKNYKIRGNKVQLNQRQPRRLGQSPLTESKTIQESSATPLSMINQSSISFEVKTSTQKVPPSFTNQFKDYDQQQILLPPGVITPQNTLTRIQVSPDQSVIYCGRQEIRMLELRNNHYTMLSRNSRYTRPFTDFKILSNSKVALIDEQTNDLLILDKHLQELKRYPSLPSANTNPRPTSLLIQTSNPSIYLYPRGDSTLSVYTVEREDMLTIPHYFPSVQGSVHPLCILMDTGMNRSIGLYTVNNIGELVHWDKNGITRKDTNRVFGKDEKIDIIEDSKDMGVFFAAGNSVATKKSKLWAVGYSSEFKILDSIDLVMAGSGNLNISSMRRCKDKDVIFVGTAKSVFVVEWTGTHLCLINIVQDINSGYITGLDTVGNYLFTVSPEDSYINKITFTSKQ
jgi:hypothetical protein